MYLPKTRRNFKSITLGNTPGFCPLHSVFRNERPHIRGYCYPSFWDCAAIVGAGSKNGPRMHPNDGRVVSNFIVQALLGRDITIYGDGADPLVLLRR